MGKYDPNNLPSPLEEPRPVDASPAPSSGGKYAPSRGGLPEAAQAMPPGASTSWGETLGRYGQTADDFVRAAANAVTFGMADRLAGVTEGGTDAAVKRSEAARARSPITSVVGDVAGGVAIPGLGGGLLAARGIQAGLRPAIARGVGYGAEGAAVGAAQGAGTTYSGVPSDYIKNAVTGGGIGFAAGGTLGSILGPRNLGPRSTAEVPSTERLYAEKGANYRDLNALPQIYEPAHLAQRADVTENALLLDRATRDRNPRTFQALDEMRGAPTAFPTGQAPVAPGDIDYIRKGLTQFNPVTEATDMRTAGTVKRALDDFMRNPPPGAVMPGREAIAAEATGLANRARGNYAGFKRGEFIDDLIDNARTSAGSAASGLNVQNVLRQGARSAVRRNKGESPASRAGLNDAEIGAMTDFARVGPADQALRYVDRIMGGGGGLGAVAATAAGVTGGAGAGFLQENPWLGATLGAGVLPAGLALRTIGNRRANRQINELADTIRRRTPLYTERAAAAPMVTPGKSGSQMLRDMMTAGLIAQGFGQQE